MSPDDIYSSVADQDVEKLEEEVGSREVQLQRVEIVTG